MTAKIARTIPVQLARLVAELELERPMVVTEQWLADAIARIGLSQNPGVAAARLRRLGWLLPLRTQTAWEFAPADRAGAFRSGDSFLELRATTMVRPDLSIAVGFESAAFLRNFASRQPQKEVIVCDPDTPMIKALTNYRRVEISLPAEAYSDLGGLKVQTPTGLLTALAVKPNGFKDWPGLAEWLEEAAQTVTKDLMAHLLNGKAAAAWARAAYLLKQGGNSAVSEAVLKARPRGKGPFYLGSRHVDGIHDKTTDVLDSAFIHFASSTQGLS